MKIIKKFQAPKAVAPWIGRNILENVKAASTKPAATSKKANQ